MNPQEPVLPDPDSPDSGPRDPVEEPPQIDAVETYGLRPRLFQRWLTVRGQR